MQSADSGTIFLDEIGDMQLPLQVKLLRVLQERKVRPLGTTRDVPINLRVISATHSDLRAAMARGEFREDLFYRLNVVQLQVPRLAERREDIPHARESLPAAHRGARRHAPEGVRARGDGAARDLALAGQRPPAREHRRAERRALAGARHQRALSSRRRSARTSRRLPSLAEARDEFVRSYLVQLLQTTGGNVSQASRLAQRNRTEFYKLLSRYEINPHTFKPTLRALSSWEAT